MQEPYSEGLASHAGPESCASVRKGRREALTGARAGRVLSLEKFVDQGADAVPTSGRQHRARRHGKGCRDLAWSETSRMHGNTSRENREIPCLPVADGAAGRSGKSEDPISR